MTPALSPKTKSPLNYCIFLIPVSVLKSWNQDLQLIVFVALLDAIDTTYDFARTDNGYLPCHKYIFGAQDSQDFTGTPRVLARGKELVIIAGKVCFR